MTAGRAGSGYGVRVRRVALLLLVVPLVGLPLAAAEPAAGAAQPASTATGRSQAARPQTSAEITPPAVAPDENAAFLYLEAFAVLEAEEVWNTNLAELAAEVCTSVTSPSSRRSLVALLEKVRIPEEGNRQATVGDACDEFSRRLESPAVKRALTLVEQGTGRPHCRFNVDYDKGAGTLLPHLSKLRHLGRFLAAVAGAAAERGDAETAWNCVLWQLAIAADLRAEPLLISQLVRIALLNLAGAVLPEMADAVPPDPETARALDRRLSSFDDPAAWVLAIDGERLLLGEWVLAQPPATLQKLLEGNAKAMAVELTVEQMTASRPAYRQAMLRLAELVAQPYHEAKAPIDALLAPIDRADPMLKLLLPALGSFCRKTAEAEALVRVSRLGLRLKQQRAAQGAYPADLAALDLTDIPAGRQHDPFTGKPLCYRLEGHGFVLYSLGPDGADDSGKPRAGNAQTGFDIVWQATR